MSARIWRICAFLTIAVRIWRVCAYLHVFEQHPDGYPTEFNPEVCRPRRVPYRVPPKFPKISPAPGTRPEWCFLSACSLEDPFCDPGLDLDLQGLDLDLQGLIWTPGARFGPPGLDLDSRGLIWTPGA